MPTSRTPFRRSFLGRATESRSASALVGFLLIWIAPGCGKRIPERVGQDANAPHVGWVIMSGDAENPDRDFVCQSNPPTECVIPADRPDERVLSDVHFYYHPASTEVRYTGSIRIGFFDDAYEINPNSNTTVKPGESPANQSVADFVSSKPGTYSMSIAVVATSVQTGQAQNIQDQVTVVVK